MRVAASLNGAICFDVNEPVSRRGGGWLAEPDLSLEQAKLALEYQGPDHASVERMRKDLTRFADLRRDGWLVFAYGPAEVFRRPWEIEAEVHAALLSRAPQLLRRVVS
jgi:very-short-patch-repair endonuclease